MKYSFLIVVVALRMPIMLFSSCCTDDTVKKVSIKMDTYSSSDSTSVIRGPKHIDAYRTEVFLQQYKDSHPSAVKEAESKVGDGKEAIDRYLAMRHLRTQSRHIEPFAEALAVKAGVSLDAPK